MNEQEPSAVENDVAPAARRPSVVRRLYDWTVHWAGTKHALPALFVLSFAESSFFPRRMVAASLAYTDFGSFARICRRLSVLLPYHALTGC